MSATEWYVIDTRTNEIVNCITADSSLGAPGRVLESMLESDHLRLDSNPPIEMLKKYRYWDERP